MTEVPRSDKPEIERIHDFQCRRHRGAGGRRTRQPGRSCCTLSPDRADGLQDVEDQLVASRILQQQVALRQQAAQAANLVEQQVLNRYQAGQVSYTEVINAQVTALNARRALVQAQSDRQVAAMALIQALGGGWRGL